MKNQYMSVGSGGNLEAVNMYLQCLEVITKPEIGSGPELEKIEKFNKQFLVAEKNNSILLAKYKEKPPINNSWFEAGLEIMLGIILFPFSMMGCSSSEDQYHHCIRSDCYTENCYYDHDAEEECECEEGYHLDCDETACYCDENPPPSEHEYGCPSCD